jgi:hypothetical protein
MARGQGTARRRRARRLTPGVPGASAPSLWRVGVNDLAQARAVIAWAAYAGIARPHLHGLDAGRMGAAYWVEVERLLGRAVVVECDSTVGTALVALRCGARRLRIAHAGPQEAALAGLIAAHGAVRETAAPMVALAPGRTAAGQLARWRCEQVTGRYAPVTQRVEGQGRSATGHEACD